MIANTLDASDGGLDANDTFVTTTPGWGTDDRLVQTGGVAPTLISVGKSKGRQGGVGKRVPIVDQSIAGKQLRRLTPVECERLQGFPDNWTAGQSDTQRYKQMGNAVTVNVVEVVARAMKPVLK